MKVQSFDTKKEAKAAYDVWGSKIVKVVGGWMVFESWEDYRIWKQQK